MTAMTKFIPDNIYPALKNCQNKLLEMGFTYVGDSFHQMQRVMHGNAPLIITFKLHEVQLEVKRALCVEKQAKLVYVNGWEDVLITKATNLAATYAAADKGGSVPSWLGR